MKSLKEYLTEGFKLGKNKIDKENGDIVDLDLPSGTLWCKYNVGATCGSDPKSWYGDYFMWGDPEPANKKICNWTNYKYCNGNGKVKTLTKYCPINRKRYWAGNGNPDNKLVLDKEDDMAIVNMKGDWKMPTKEQFEELINNTTYKFVKNYDGISGLNGTLLTSKINSNKLFFPHGGYINEDSIDYVGTYTFLWSSTVDADDPDSAFNYEPNVEWMTSYYRIAGYPVRAVMN